MAEDGEPWSAFVRGCGAHGFAQRDGAFFLQVEAGEPCELWAEKGANMARATGPPVEIHPEPGVDLIGVRLVAPERPEWRDPTKEESLRSKRQMCEYWPGTWAEMTANLKVRLPPGPERDAQVAETEAQRQKAIDEYCAVVDAAGG